MQQLLLILAAILTCAATADITWEFDDSADLVESHCIAGVRVHNSAVIGQTEWDPYIRPKLPAEGLDVSNLPYLTARIYSSEKADVLDVFYSCSDGLWGLGRTHPVAKGWAVYRADLRQAAWTESGMAAAARQWGGVAKRIVSFRIDPGNEDGRWLVIDSLSLTAEPTGELGVFPEPTGVATDLALACPDTIQAGEPLNVRFTCKAQLPEGAEDATVLIKLLTGNTPQRSDMQTVPVKDGAVAAAASLPLSAFARAGEYQVTAVVIGLDCEPVSHTLTVLNSQEPVPAVTKVAPFGGAPAMFVNGEPRPLITYVHHGGQPGILHTEMAAADIKLYSDWFGTSVSGNLGRTADGTYDYSAYDTYFTTVLDAVPDAMFLPHIAVVAPMWWQQEHPEECCLYSNGLRGPSSLSSKRWMQDMAPDLQRLIAHLRSAPYANRILGYIFYSGYTAEWQNWGTWQEYSCDYSEPAIAAFREWLGEKYETDAALQNAWADPRVTLATATVPSPEERWDEGSFVRDPATDQHVIDYHLCSSDVVADAICFFARVTKEAAPDQLAGTYYGYMAAHSSRQPNCGHNDLTTVLNCPDIDFLMSPPMYAHRGLGETSTFMSTTGSVAAHGKLWSDESDLRTYLSDIASGYGRVDSVEGSVAVHWREFANVMTRRAAVNWFDMSGGWFSAEPMWSMFRRQMQIAEPAFREREPFTTDVALIVDERSYACFRRNEALSAMVQMTVAHMPESGLSWEFYQLSDVDALPPHKVYAVLNAAAMTDETGEKLRALARRTGGTIVYVYAPGYCGEGRLDLERLERIVGMDLRVHSEPSVGTYTIKAGTPWAEGIAEDARLGSPVGLAPWFVVDDPQAETIAEYTSGAGAAIARKVVDGIPVIYCAPVAMPPSLWRNIGRAAGAHVYSETDDGIYTDDRYFALHAASDGAKTVRFRAAGRITDLISGEVVAEAADTLTREMKRGETVFVRIDRPAQ